MTILSVEDNPAMRRLIRHAVGHLAEVFLQCEDGADALPIYEAHHPDLVLMDIRTPRMDGLAATKQIRSRHPEARIVILTDYDDDDLRAAAIDAGACGYLLKQDLAKVEELIEGTLRGLAGYAY